jgi:zinc D-Ala-D-Ala carboxypeptidase
MADPSRHLSLDELRCHDAARTPYPEAFIKDGRLAVLARAFEALRAKAGGKPLKVLSGYRTPDHNRRIGGAKHSQHVLGRALDLRPPKGMTPAELGALARQVSDIRGMAVYPTFLHIDVRTSARLVVWNGRRTDADRSAT